jgi:hypothetical protein
VSIYRKSVAKTCQVWNFQTEVYKNKKGANKMLTKTIFGLVVAILFFPITAMAENVSPVVLANTTAIEQTESQPLFTPTARVRYTHHIRVLIEEMTLVQVVDETYANIKAVCAGVGLKNVKPSPTGPVVIIPNAGDLAVNGSNVAIRISEKGEMIFIPRVQGQRIKMPMDVGEKLTGYEVADLTFAEGMQLMAADKLVWTARTEGPYGNGHGIPGHIASCDPRYNEDDQ